MSETDDTLNALQRAIEKLDPDAVEEALLRVFALGPSPDHVPALIDLVEMSWHFRHEDVVRLLQQLRPPEAVGALYRAALKDHENLQYDEFFGLARKCTWALADIGTEEAQEALRRLTGADNPKIAEYAQKRLDNWDPDRHPKHT